jgi:hypothetical protein
MSNPALRPKSKAKTAYELLEEIRALTLEEPRRYNQNQYLSFDVDEEHGGPACGTVGCRAGWVVALRAKRPRLVTTHWIYARKVLGLDAAQCNDLFGYAAVGGLPGTREHAELGAAQLTEFMRRHEQQLKRKRL